MTITEQIDDISKQADMIKEQAQCEILNPSEALNQLKDLCLELQDIEKEI